MRATKYLMIVFTVCGAVQVDNNPWTVSNPETNRWLRKGKVQNIDAESTTTSTTLISNSNHSVMSTKYEQKNLKFSTLPQVTSSSFTSTNPPQTSKLNTFPASSVTFSESTISTSESPLSESTDTTDTTLEPRENPKPHDFYAAKEKSREKLHVKIASNISQVIMAFSWFCATVFS